MIANTDESVQKRDNKRYVRVEKWIEKGYEECDVTIVNGGCDRRVSVEIDNYW